MKIKNIGTSIISIGNTVILPDETVDISDKGYQNNDTINFLIETKRLALVKEKKAEKPAAKNDKNSGASAEKNKDETPTEEQK